LFSFDNDEYTIFENCSFLYQMFFSNVFFLSFFFFFFFLRKSRPVLDRCATSQGS